MNAYTNTGLYQGGRYISSTTWTDGSVSAADSGKTLTVVNRFVKQPMEYTQMNLGDAPCVCVFQFDIQTVTNTAVCELQKMDVGGLFRKVSESDLIFMADPVNLLQSIFNPGSAYILISDKGGSDLPKGTAYYSIVNKKENSGIYRFCIQIVEGERYYSNPFEIEFGGKADDITFYGIKKPAVGSQIAASKEVSAYILRRDNIVESASIEWYDTYENRALSDSETFKAGHSYYAMLSATIKEGYYFPYSNILSKYDGNLTVKYDDGTGTNSFKKSSVTNDGRTLTLRSCETRFPGEYIEDINLTLDKPEAGKTPATTVAVGADSYRLESITWEPVVTEFSLGKTYTATITLVAEDGYEFSYTSIRGQINGSAYGVTYINSNKVKLIYSVKAEEAKPADPLVAFVERMYTVALGRPGFTDEEVNGWVNQLRAKTIDGATIAKEFILSPEFEGRNLNNDKYIETLYETFFNRAGDAEGKGGWMNALENGYTRRFVLMNFVNSAEYDSLCKEYGINRGTMTDETQNSGLYGFVERMYTIALGRTGSFADIKAWAEQLELHNMDGAGIVAAFILSPEYREKGLSNEAYVDNLYATLYDRAADPEGKMGFVTTLNNGGTREQVLQGFVISAEFQTLAQSFGVIGGYMYEDGTTANVGIYNFVERLYTKVLGRAAENAGLQGWATNLINKDLTPKAITLEFFKSSEFESRGLSNAEFVENLYQTCMNRAADADGKAGWIGNLETGEWTRMQVVEAFADSQEFRQIMANFGL